MQNNVKKHIFAMIHKKSCILFTPFHDGKSGAPQCGGSFVVVRMIDGLLFSQLCAATQPSTNTVNLPTFCFLLMYLCHSNLLQYSGDPDVISTNMCPLHNATDDKEQ